MNEIALKYSEKQILTFFQKVRLEKAKELSDVNAGRRFTTREDASLNEKINSFGKFLKRNLKSTDDVKKDAADSLYKFNQEHNEVVSKEEVTNELDRLFENDKYGLAKLVLAVSIILDDEYKYEYIEEGLEEASLILYKDSESLNKIKTQLEENYRSISLKTLNDTSCWFLLSASIVSAVFVIPVLGLITAAAGIITLNEIVKQNKDKIRREFRNTTSEANAFYLALQLTYIQRIKDTISSDEFKEELDSILKHIEELKSDLDYYLFVERESTKVNHDKLVEFNYFYKRLMKILEVE